LIAGKGHENYQLIGSQRLPFSDAVTVQQVLQQGRAQGGVSS
jgi:UDP-N-acetylmuramyl tripeptide synthase